MPIPDMTGLPPFAEFQDIVNKVNVFVQQYNNLMLSLDSLNVVSLTADHIDAGTINANIVTIRGDYEGGAFIVIDSTGIRINDGTQDTFIADTHGNVTLLGTIEALAGHIGGFTIEADKLSSDSGAGIIQGGTFRTAASGERIEISLNQFKMYNSANQLNGIFLGDPSGIPGMNFGDLGFYYLGVETGVIQQIVDGLIIKAIAGHTLFLGDITGQTEGRGDWFFSGNATFDNDVSGKISDAYSADHATTASSADELSPSGEISWAQVLKGGSDIADLDTKNLSSLTQNSSNRTVTDTEKATWNAKAPTASPTFTGTVTLPSTTSIGTISNTELGYLDGVTSAIQTQLNAITNRTAVSAASTATQAISATTWTKIVFGSETRDRLNEFNLTTSIFTAQVAGDYLFSVMANWVSLAANTRTIIRLLIGGVTEIFIDDRLSGNAISQSSVSGATQIPLAANDTVEIDVYTTSAATLQVTNTRFSVCRVAP